MLHNMRKVLFLICFSCLSSFLCQANPQHVILITIDGGAAYQLDDPDLPLPNIRALIKEGVWPDSSQTIFPSVTHPSHTTIVTGVTPLKHGDLSNSLYDRATDRSIPMFTLPHSQVVMVKTIFDTAKARHLTTAAVFWPESIDDPAVDFNLMIRNTGSTRVVIENPWTKELRADGIPIDFENRILQEKLSPAMLDDLNTQALCDVIRKHRPNLATIHFVTTDSMEHDYGPHDAMAQAAFRDADALIGRIVAATRQAGMYGQTAFIVTADHGFTGVHWELNLRAFLAQAGLQDKIRIYDPGWSPLLRLLPSFDAASDGPKLQRLFATLRSNPHIFRVYQSSDFPSLDLPRYEDSERIPGQYMVIPDIDTFLVDAPDNSTALRRCSHVTFTHGYLPQYPAMYPLLVMAGNGFKKGIRIGHVQQIDIAPTITRLLELPALPFDGHVLDEALEP